MGSTPSVGRLRNVFGNKSQSKFARVSALSTQNTCDEKPADRPERGLSFATLSQQSLRAALSETGDRDVDRLWHLVEQSCATTQPAAGSDSQTNTRSGWITVRLFVVSTVSDFFVVRACYP